jgi:ADP-ribose pyrophosphatase YjhB (NUDIX family)
MLKIILVKGIVKFKDKYLFLKKQETSLSENIGKWECSGGVLNKNENPKKALLRELFEETGLKGKITKTLPTIQIKDKKSDSYCHVYLIKVKTNKVKLSREHSSYKWLKASQVKNLPLVLYASLLLEYFNNEKKYLKV